MKLLFPVLASVALAAAAEKVYSPSADITCNSGANGGWECYRGQDGDAEVQEVVIHKGLEARHEKRQGSCDINLPWVSACAISCATQLCNRSWCEKGICHCAEC
ncbi:uncharacterized protein B0H64DRAFT_121603 [Chaetomium fimeti]|uniref:Uncharacterized protein n=1 Tax=Chaetomium fimeti TaxID=1854472 RepID=A0AAE0LTS1_9PEZI|nr:hypothetical protein B0H64DRAFT_121603 [Chaetomium fimeti]